MDNAVSFSLLDLIQGATGPRQTDGGQGATLGGSDALLAAASIFKALGHEGRLRILCHLSAGECSVSQLENLIDARQSVVSQHLARLRADRLVRARRDGNAIYYSLSDPRIADLIGPFIASLPDDARLVPRIE